MKPELQATVTQMGLVARECLAPGQRGQVFASVSRAVYLLTDDEELFWLSTETGAMHRRCAAVSLLPPGSCAGSRFHVEGSRLIIAPSFVIDIQPANLWQASMRVESILPENEITARVYALIDYLDLSQAMGFGQLISSIRSLAKGDTTSPLPIPVDPISTVAQPTVLGFVQACRQANSVQISKQIDNLIGLGAGLTPSGDDCVGGFLFALKSLQNAYPDSNLVTQAIPIELFRPRTNLISFTLLRDLDEGHGPAPLHEVMSSLLHAEEFEHMSYWVRQLTQIGHSTGWDMLTGLLTGLLFTHLSYRYVRSDFLVSLTAVKKGNAYGYQTEHSQG